MLTDTSQLDIETLARLRKIDAKMLLEYRAALVHTVAAHPEHAPVVQSTGLCDEEIMIVCGPALYARVQGLQREAQELYATGLAAVTLNKAKGP